MAAQTLRQAQATLENVRAALARSQELFEKGFVGQAALDDARKTSELADAQMRATRMQLETTGATGSDRALAVADLSAALASAQAARARSGSCATARDKRGAGGANEERSTIEARRADSVLRHGCEVAFSFTAWTAVVELPAASILRPQSDKTQ